jgi:hypothetical protein
MNPSWLTGTMPEAMYRREHPEHLEDARKDTERYIEVQLERVRPVDGAGDDEDNASLTDEHRLDQKEEQKHEDDDKGESGGGRA